MEHSAAHVLRALHFVAVLWVGSVVSAVYGAPRIYRFLFKNKIDE